MPNADLLLALLENETLGRKTFPRQSAIKAYPPSGTGPAIGAPLTAEQGRVLIEHLPIVRFLARRIHERLPQHVEIEDLISAGVVGLIDACSKFDPAKKVPFRSYAQFRIRGAILDRMRTLDLSPRELSRKGRAVEETIRVVKARLGHAPNEGEVALDMGLSLGEYQQLLGDLKDLEFGRLHVERNKDSGEEELAYVPGKLEEGALFRCSRDEFEARLADAIMNLPDRERLVMTLYYYEEMTMREISLKLGVVESRVSQVHASAVVHLRVAMRDLTVLSKPKRRKTSAQRASCDYARQHPIRFFLVNLANELGWLYQVDDRLLTQFLSSNYASANQE
jgi:RNA polymerase sigma factor for flagellar operon FliA